MKKRMILKNDKVSCIVPAYNESKRISNVLSILVNIESIDEIIVVNDGSTDNTLDIVKSFKTSRFGKSDIGASKYLSTQPSNPISRTSKSPLKKIKLINNKKNQGKSHAIFKGIKESRNDIIMLIDSDLLGLKEENINQLINPIIKKEADLSISLRGNAPLAWKLIGIDFISGERVFSKKLVDNYKDLLNLPSFGLEVFFNKHIIAKKWRIKVVKWPNVQSPYPHKKFGFIKGNLRLIGMMFQIFSTVGFFGVLNQIRKMFYLKS